MRFMPASLVFDLDGTLINSNEGILRSIDYAFESNGITPDKKPVSTMIGPPLLKILK